MEITSAMAYLTLRAELSLQLLK